MIWDSNPDFRINLDPDPDVCRIGPKILWIHFLVGLSHFAKYRKILDGDCMRNAKKSPNMWLHNGEKNENVIRNPYRDLFHDQKLITFRGPLAHVCQG